MGKKFGSWFKSKRATKEIPLVDFCLDNDLDSSYWSKVERGIFKPPQSLSINRMIIAYMIKKECFGIDDLSTYMDLIYMDNIADVKLTPEEMMPTFYPINEDSEIISDYHLKNLESIIKEEVNKHDNS